MVKKFQEYQQNEQSYLLFVKRGRHGHDRMVVGFTTTCAISVPIATKVVSINPAHGEVYLI